MTAKMAATTSMRPTYISISLDAENRRTDSPAAFVVYSIGKDRNDDGGVPKPPRGKSEDGYDLAFVVRR